MKKYAIVLSGGGSKGAYQAGFWKAIRKMWIHYDIVTGTSVGALNGMLMVQNDYEKCLDIWENIHFKDLFVEEFPGKHSTVKEKTEIYKKYADGFFKEGGMDVSRLEELVASVFNEKKFYGTSIQYGLITYNLSKLKPVCLTKTQMPNGIAKEYVIASATCFPAFKTKTIDGDQYIDGGYYDNLPINLAIDMGAKNIIAVDLDAIGLKKTIKNPSVPIIKVTPRNHLESFLIFDSQTASEAINFGYNDTMKTFHKLDGNIFTFKKNHLRRNNKKIQSIFVKKAKEILEIPRIKILDNFLKSSDFKHIIEDKDVDRIINQTLEYTGEIFCLKQSSIYDIKIYNQTIKQMVKEMDSISVQGFLEKIKDKKLKNIIHLKTVVKYFYDILIQDNLTIDEKKELLTIAYVFPKELLSAIYLTTI